jgi:hypothetical protein
MRNATDHVMIKQSWHTGRTDLDESWLVKRFQNVLLRSLTVGAIVTGSSGIVATELSASQDRTTNQIDSIQLTVPSDSGAQFSLASLASCQIGDALLIVKNVGTRSARITGVAMDVPSTATPTRDQTRYRVQAIRPGATTGEIASSFRLTAIPPSTPSYAVGAVLKPFTVSGRWYAIIARMSVRTVHHHGWLIRGMMVSIVQGKMTSHLFFPQVVRLPKDSC